MKRSEVANEKSVNIDINILRKEEFIISIKEARKILGFNYHKKSDEEIKKLIKELSFLSNLLIEDGVLFKLE